MNLMVSFNIRFKTNNERLLKILNHYGFKRIQDNLYFADIENIELNKIQNEFMENIKDKDSIIVIPLCKSCFEKLKYFGYNIKFEDELYKIF